MRLAGNRDRRGKRPAPPNHTNTSLKPRKSINRLWLPLFKALAFVFNAVSPRILRFVSVTGRVFAHVFVLPPYRFITSIRLRFNNARLPAHGLLLTTLTHRYLFHGLIVLVTLATVSFNLFGREANAQDVGQTSLLYDMATGGGARSTEEDVRPELLVQDSHYAAEDSLIAIPDIDFDYQETEILPIATETMPGTLIANLSSHTPNQPDSPAQERTETETYVVQSGDTLGVIAQKFGVTIGTILWANNKSATQYIRPGDSLRIPPVSGVLVTVESGDTLTALSNKYDSDLDKIVAFNRLDPEKPLSKGVELVLPGGEPPQTTTIARTTSGGTSSAYDAAAPTFVTKPANADPTNGTGKLLWPTSGHVITQYYGWSHTGLDIDGDYDSPLYASHDGVVTTSGWNSGGYGLQILIDSGDGVKTRYAHASKLFVKAGETVKKGQVIAMMGTTGRSTGTHIHYEVYINGRRVNPLAYIR